MNELQIFKSNEFGNVRSLLIDGNPYFVAKDVSDILGYQNGSRDINRHVDDEDKLKAMVFDGKQDKETIVINESGLYSLVLSSKLPSAKKFKRWVTDEVLPTIRKHGAYMTAETLETALLNPDSMIKILTSLKEEREKRQQLELINKQQYQIIGELKPKADYTDRILQSKSLVNVNQIAKDYGMSAKTFNKKLHSLGVQYLEGGQWLLYSKYQKKGYTSSDTFDFNHSDGTPDVKMRTVEKEWGLATN